MSQMVDVVDQSVQATLSGPSPEDPEDPDKVQVETIEPLDINYQATSASNGIETLSDEEEPVPSHWSKLKLCIQRFEFEIQVVLIWTVLCVPLNVTALVLWDETESSKDSKASTSENVTSNKAEFSCHELKGEWKDTVSWSQFLIQGIGVTVIGLLGIAGNILSVIVLLKTKCNRNFHLLLVGLAVIDTFVLLILVIEMSVVTLFLEDEPSWYIWTYPFVFHPVRGIIQTAAIFMVVAVTTERYRVTCHPMAYRQSYIKYILIVLVMSTGLEFPRFFEIRLNKSKDYYWTTNLMENPIYVRMNSYWVDIFATGLLPLASLCYMNLKIFLKIRASSRYALQFVSNRRPNSQRQHQHQLSRASRLSRQPTIGDDVEEFEMQQLDPNGRGSTRKPTLSAQRSIENPDDKKLARTGAQYVRRRQEKSTAILVAIVVVFVCCHIHRLAFRIYEMALPETSVYQHYRYCSTENRYHVPVAIYFLTHSHILFLVINSSVNFVIYCFMGRHFRQQLKILTSNFCSRQSD